MANYTVAENHHYKHVRDTMHQVNTQLIAVEQSGMGKDNGDVIAALGGIQVLASGASEALEKVGDMEVKHG